MPFHSKDRVRLDWKGRGCLPSLPDPLKPCLWGSARQYYNTANTSFSFSWVRRKEHLHRIRTHIWDFSLTVCKVLFYGLTPSHPSSWCRNRPRPWFRSHSHHAATPVAPEVQPGLMLHQLLLNKGQRCGTCRVLIIYPVTFCRSLLLSLSNEKTETHRDQHPSSGHTAMCATKQSFVRVYMDTKNCPFPP